jgi:hypothetical protein
MSDNDLTQKDQIELNSRKGAVGEDAAFEGLFPFEAFEFDSPDEDSTPTLTLKSPWEFEVSSGNTSGIGLPSADFTSSTFSTYLSYFLPPLCPTAIHKSLVAAMSTELCSGTCTTNTASKVIDSSATFSTDGVVAGDIIHNVTDDYWGTVTSVDSETQITADWDVCPDGNEAYKIYDEPEWPGNILECDGSQVSDADSPINGQYLPNLVESGANSGRYIRGGESSGVEQGDRSNYYRFVQSVNNVGDKDRTIYIPETGYSDWVNVDGTSSWHRLRFLNSGDETRGLNVTMMWLMRIK